MARFFVQVHGRGSTAARGRFVRQKRFTNTRKRNIGNGECIAER
ncbi:hypothetical protein BRI6_2642 [plant metagenome]|uniref:Uncharacterized protein n=1 Tax=plant metagenome TaxID=1297885 RepID=A0A484NVE0_9ZZZZ